MTNHVSANGYFGVDIDLAAVGVDILVNDIPVYSDEKSGQLTIEYPCPESIVDGMNTLAVVGKVPVERGGVVADTFQPGAYVTAKLFYQANETAKKEYLTILKLQANEKGVLELVEEVTKTDQPPVIMPREEVGVAVTSFAKIKSPFPIWAWQSGLKIENNEAEFDSLLAAYREVYDALANNDQARLRKLYSHRAKEIAAAYHLVDEDAGHEKISTGVDAQDQRLRLHDFFDRKDALLLQIHADGKLARLMTPKGGVQPIVFIQKDNNLLHLHKFMFYKNSNNEWIMIR